MPIFRLTFKSKAGSTQRMTLEAKDTDEAKRLGERAQFRRHERFPLTFDRLQQAHDAGELDAKQFKNELERRKRDQGRYDDGELKLIKIEKAV